MVQKSKNDIKYWQKEAILLLKDLIPILSISKEEHLTADLIYSWFQKKGKSPLRLENNVWVVSKQYDSAKPTILLNSHHDTVKPNPHYTKNPLLTIEDQGKLYGLGSNDAGGPLVALIATFMILDSVPDLKYNIIVAATAEEEISGKNGIELLLKSGRSDFPFAKNKDDFAIVGEPTLMQMAVAERGLMVIDAVNEGVPGHAARKEGNSALLKAVNDITILNNLKFDKVSDLLGAVTITPTVIFTENKAHNMIPSLCSYVIDCRINELYTFEEVLEKLKSKLDATLTPRSMRLKSSMIPLDHPIVQAGITMGKTYYGSPTTSDKSLISAQTLKMGPGDSARSHTADEFIYLEEIEQSIEEYTDFILIIAQ